MSVKDLIVRFKGDTSHLSKEIDNVHSKVEGFHKVLGGVAALGAAIGAVSFFKNAIDEAGAAAKVTRQTNAVLKSTGEVAKVSSEQVKKLSEELALKTGIDGKIIQSGENVLLTFTKVRNEAGRGNDIFNQGTTAALNMSVALGKDLQGSVIQVGKALNDPVKGITALQKAGVSFTAQQKDEIKALVKKGDTLGAQKIILKELNTEFGGMAEASSSSSAKMHVAFLSFEESIGKLLLPVFKLIFTWVTRSVLPAVEQLAKVIVNFLTPIVKAVAGVFKSEVIPALSGMWEWLEKNRVIYAALGGAVTGLLAIAAAIKVINVVQAIWNTLTETNPVVLVVTLIAVVIGALVAAFIYAYQHSEKFRDIVKGVMTVVSAVISGAWNNVIKPTFDALVVAFKWTGDRWSEIWNNVLHPIFIIFGQVAVLLWNDFLKPIFGTIGDIFTRLGVILKSVWEVVLKPVFTAIGVVVKALWLDFLWPIFQLIFAVLAAFGQVLLWVWNTFVYPYLQLIGMLFKWLWEVAIGPTVRAIGDVIVWLWMHIFKPSFEAIGAVCKFVWDNVIRPVFEAIKDGIDNVRKGFQTGSSGIEKIWNGLKAIVAAPINFIIGTVFNNGIRKVWNWIAEKIGLPQLGELPLVKYAAGGEVRGPGGPKADRILAALSDGEYVVSASAYARNRALVQAINAGHAFAGGGPITYGVNGNQGNNRTDPGGGGTPDANNLNWSKFIGDFLSNPLGALTNKFSGVLNGLDQFAGTPFGKAIVDVPRVAVKNAVTWLKDKVSGFFTALSAGGGGGGAAQWSGLVLQVLAMLGQSPSLLPNVLRRINQESGGNPNAINLTDSNAQAGHPSQGLMQTIPGTFAAYAGPFAGLGITNPLASIYAGLNYAIHNYPSLQYAMDKPGGYVNGGWLDPGKLAYNETSQPEAILNRQQWNAVANSKGGNTYVLNVYEAANSTIDLREQFAKLELMDAP